ncbi:MAG: hypothetical protein J0G29_02650 [Alphaproteobacteria bacterium]|nr:hypothetical protein [Alphaproteobacteria bacterium]OJV45180.1 MAG: hypothetical protein BGO28_00030 [Alphaproteobacteria bacterium 43-37]
MFEQVCLNGDGASIIIDFPYEKHGDDKKWVNLNICIKIGEFIGKIFPMFHLSDLELFEKALRSALSSTRAKFENMEDDIKLEFVTSSQGAIQIIGAIKYLSNAQASLAFDFFTDHEALKSFLASISKLLSRHKND